MRRNIGIFDIPKNFRKSDGFMDAYKKSEKANSIKTVDLTRFPKGIPVFLL
jgi:hypothetical protein